MNVNAAHVAVGFIRQVILSKKEQLNSTSKSKDKSIKFK